MIQRQRLTDRVRTALARSRAVVLVGPRQSGKSTLARQFVAVGDAHYFDLENPLDRARLAEPMAALAPLDSLVVVDEVQHAPDLFKVLRVLIDRPERIGRPGQYLLLGSASPALLRQTGESLAGRVEVVEVAGFSIDEVGAGLQHELWLRGGYPLAFLAASDDDSLAWRLNAVNRLVESDLPQFGINVPAPAMLRFWSMLAHYHGQVWNAAQLAKSLGTSENTARRYLDILTGSYMIRLLPPWFQNLRKRQVKAGKVYLRDSGLLHALLQMPSAADLQGHPKVGASWEGFALEQVIAAVGSRDVYFWATHGGAELDLLVRVAGKHYGFEFKYADAPGTSRSMHVAIEDLGLEHLWVVYPGHQEYALDEKITALPIAAVPGFNLGRQK